MNYTLKELEDTEKRMIAMHLFDSGRHKDQPGFWNRFSGSLRSWAVDEESGSYVAYDPFKTREEACITRMFFYFSGHMFFLRIVSLPSVTEVSFDKFPSAAEPLREGAQVAFTEAIRVYGPFGTGPENYLSRFAPTFVDDDHHSWIYIC